MAATLLLSLFFSLVRSATVQLDVANLSNGPLLNASSLLAMLPSTNTSSSNSSLAGDAKYPTTTDGCFEPPSSPTSLILPTNKDDCYTAADNLLDVVFSGYAPDTPLTFGRNDSTSTRTRGRPHIDIELPKTSKYGTCSIFINVAPSHQDTFELWNLYGAALDLVTRCTIGGKRIYGGLRTVGPKGVVQVAMAGRVPEETTPTLGTA